MSEAAARPVRARPWRIVGLIVVAIGVLALVVLAALYAARRQIAREAVTGWLRSKGVASESEFQELGPGHLVGRVRIGPANTPDLTVDRVEVDYSLAGLVAGRGVEVTRIRLLRPVLKARWHGGQFSAGALDPLIADFRRRPLRPGAPSPRVQIDQGRMQLSTDYGLVRASADALVDNARLVRLDASTAPMRLTANAATADLGAAGLRARASGGRLEVSLRAPFVRAATGKDALAGGELDLDLTGAYPDLRAAVPSTGHAAARLTAASAILGGAAAKALAVDAASDWRWTRAGTDELQGDVKLSGQLREAATGELRLATLAGDLGGRFGVGAETFATLAGGAAARGGWDGLGRPAKGDSKEIVAVKRAAPAFRADAQGLRVAYDRSGVRLALAGPARILPDAGGAVRLTPRGGGYRLTAEGGGLPSIEAQIRRFALTDGGATAAGTIKAALSLGPLESGTYDAAGELRISGGVTRFAASRCVSVTAKKVELGANDAERLSAQVCPDGAPMLELVARGWRLAGRAQRAAADVPFLQAGLSEGGGRLRLADHDGTLSAEIGAVQARVKDEAKAERFRPLAMSGDLRLVNDVWTGRLAFALPKGPRIAEAVLRQDGRSGAGAVEISAPEIAFAPGGLQPSDLSPVAEPLGSQAEGRASFAGAFRWVGDGGTSSGELKIPALAFKSPAGPVSGLSGDIRFTSLVPLIAPPGQTLHVARVGWTLPITDITASLELQEKALVVASAEGAAGGGRLFSKDVVVPLDPGQPIHGAARLAGVQLHDLVEASPFGDRVDLDARVSGEIPFEVQDGKVHIAAGDLHAIAPGRLSIARAALTSVAAQGSIQAPAPAAAAAAGSTDTFTDFAYQALENLAFSTLDARVDTRPNGRLGVVFHIVGYHDPPKHQEITLSWWDLVRRKFLGKKLPLPSGTGVDLTLDTSLNLDDLLKDYADFERLRSSGPVQP